MPGKGVVQGERVCGRNKGRREREEGKGIREKKLLISKVQEEKPI